MDANDEGRKRVTIPSFLRRSGIKIKEDLRTRSPEQEQPNGGSRSSNRGSEGRATATQGLLPQHTTALAFKPRSFLNGLVTTPPTGRRDPLNAKMDSFEARKAGRESDNDNDRDMDDDAPTEGGESEVLGAAASSSTGEGASTTHVCDSSPVHFMVDEDHSEDTESGGGSSRTLTPDSSTVDGADEDAEGEVTATTQLKLSPATAAYEVAHEYQRRVDRGEVQAPTDQDRANYVDWKRNYTAWLAQKRHEDEGKEAAGGSPGRIIRDPAGWALL